MADYRRAWLGRSDYLPACQPGASGGLSHQIFHLIRVARNATNVSSHTWLRRSNECQHFCVSINNGVLTWDRATV